jgi:hypothetical protein
MRIIIRLIVFILGEKRIISCLRERRDSTYSDIRRSAGMLCSMTHLQYVTLGDPEEEAAFNLRRVVRALHPQWESADSAAELPPNDSASLRDIFHNAPDSCYYRAHDAKKKI